MKKRILTYRKSIDALLAHPKQSAPWPLILEEHLTQIAFFQHERLIHLIVTSLVAVLLLLCVGIAMAGGFLSMLLLALPLFVLLVPYLAHYYLLENEVQKMYGQYDQLRRLAAGHSVLCSLTPPERTQSP